MDLDYIGYFNNTLGMPSEAAELALETAARINSCDGLKLAVDEAMRDDLAGSSAQSKLAAIAAEYGIPEKDVFLACSIDLSSHTLREYRERKIPMEIFWATLRDIKIWCDFYHRDSGEWGLMNYGWIEILRKMHVFRLGRLEFNISRFENITYSNYGVTVTPHSRVINVHIPEDGPLERNLVDDSYKRAYDFFGASEIAVFVCSSWLMYDSLTDALPPYSHIRSFRGDYDILKSWDRGAKSDVWRIFGHRDSYAAGELPTDTSLRRSMADWLARGNKLGEGYGVMLHSGSSVISRRID